MAYFRFQTKGISLEEMQAHNSADGASESETHDGLCASNSVSAQRSYIKSFCSGAADGKFDDEFEVLVIKGNRMGDVYDGILIRPTEIIERVVVSNFFNDDRFCEYE